MVEDLTTDQALFNEKERLEVGGSFRTDAFL